MQVIGIIFFACLAFAIVILILITCCFFKVSGGKDIEMCKPSAKATDTIHRMNQITQNKTNEEKPTNANVILFINKKKKYAEEKRNYQSDGKSRYQSGGDSLGIGHFNDGFCGQSWGHHSSDQGYDDCGHTDGGHGDCGGDD